MTAKAPTPKPEGVVRPPAPAAPPRKKSNTFPTWLQHVNSLIACPVCGTVAGPCLAKGVCSEKDF